MEQQRKYVLNKNIKCTDVHVIYRVSIYIHYALVILGILHIPNQSNAVHIRSVHPRSIKIFGWGQSQTPPRNKPLRSYDPQHSRPLSGPPRLEMAAFEILRRHTRFQLQRRSMERVERMERVEMEQAEQVERVERVERLGRVVRPERKATIPLAV